MYNDENKERCRYPKRCQLAPLNVLELSPPKKKAVICIQLCSLFPANPLRSLSLLLSSFFFFGEVHLRNNEQLYLPHRDRGCAHDDEAAAAAFEKWREKVR